MAGADVLTYSGQAAIAYQDALNQARNAQNALLRQYGFTAPSASGEYSVEGAQGAFDPNSLFDKASGGIDKAKLQQLAGSLQIGGTGVLADIMRGGASAEADVVSEARSRGFGGEVGGGLLAQRRQLAEAQTGGELAAGKEKFLAGIGEALSPIGGAWQGLQNAQAMDELARQQAEAMKATIPAQVDLMETNPAASGKPTLGAGPQGEFMSKFTAAQRAGARPSQRLAAFKALRDSYSLSPQQKSRVDAAIKQLGG